MLGDDGVPVRQMDDPPIGIGQGLATRGQGLLAPIGGLVGANERPATPIQLDRGLVEKERGIERMAGALDADGIMPVDVDRFQLMIVGLEDSGPQLDRNQRRELFESVAVGKALEDRLGLDEPVLADS